MKHETMAAFITAASRMVVGFRAGRAADGSLTPETHALVARTAEKLPEYAALVAEALAGLPRYRPTRHERTGLLLLREGECRDELRAYLQRTRFYADLWESTIPAAGTVLDAFLTAAEVSEYEALGLIPLDGLSIDGSAPIPLPGHARLVKLTQAEWAAFFEADLFAAPKTDRLADLWCVELRERRSKPTPNPIWIHFDPPYRVAMHRAGRWLHCINLAAEGFVRPVAVYTKLNTPLALKPVEVIDVAEPLWLPRGDIDGEWEEPFVSVRFHDAEQLAATIAALDAGHAAASARDQRLDTALHWFTRVADRLYGFEEGLAFGEALDEELVPDCFTILEALLLRPRETGKGPKIAERAAALLAQDDSKIGALQADIRAAYAVRNDLVHGDARPGRDDLERTGRRLRIWVKQIVAALLLLQGDLDKLIRGVEDAATRASNRALVPRYADR